MKTKIPTTCSAPAPTFTSATSRSVDRIHDSIKGIAPERRPCRWAIGAWVYDSYHRANVQILSVHFDTWDRVWHANTAGHGARDWDFSEPRPDAPWHLHQLTQTHGCSWALTGRYAACPFEGDPRSLPVRDIDTGASHWEPLAA